jgi:hypothetical protein
MTDVVPSQTVVMCAVRAHSSNVDIKVAAGPAAPR